MSLNNLKNLPNSVRTFIRPMLYLSLAMHGLLLMVPIATETEVKSSAKKKESVKITQLPTPTSPQPLPVATLPKPSPIVKQNPIPPTRPQAKTPSARLNPIIESPKPAAIVQQNFASVTPTPIASVTPAPITTPTPTPIASVTPTPTPAAATSTELAAGVPNLENAQQTCQGFCWKIAQTPFRQVSSTLKEKFESQGYAVEKQDIEDDTGRSVYKVSKDGKIDYLNVLSKDNGDTVYFTTERELTAEEIRQRTTS